MSLYNEEMYKIIEELQIMAYEQQKNEEDKYQKKLIKNNLNINNNIPYTGSNNKIPQRILRSVTVISQLFLLDKMDEIIKILSKK